MLTFFDLPPEVRNAVYELVLPGRRLKYLRSSLCDVRGLRPRTSLLYVSKLCHSETLDMLLNLVELDDTYMVGMPTIPPSTISTVIGKLRKVVLDGRWRNYGDGALIMLIPNLSSLTLLCGHQYDVSHVGDPDARTPEMKAIKTIRARPWRVFGTKHWKPRNDLKGFISVWKSKRRSFLLSTEVGLVVGGDPDVWVLLQFDRWLSANTGKQTGKFNFGTRTMMLWRNHMGPYSETCEFPLEMLDI